MFQGYVEYIQAFRIHGWAYSPQTPDRRLTVEVACGDTVLGTTTANVCRDDLRTAAIGDGCHGFVFDFSENLDNGDLQQLVARVITDDGAAVPLERLSYTPRAEVSWETPSPQDPGSAPAYPGPLSDPVQHPMFILGSTRSGTSAIAQALTATGRFWGCKEGHLLDLLAHLADSLRSFYDEKGRAGAINGATFISQVPRGFVQKGLQRLFIDLVRTMMPSPWWFDKTPNHHMIQLAPLFLAMWPQAKFIFLKRRALEFIESRRRKFPQSSFEENCREWISIMSAWTHVREGLQGRTLEIDQVYMAQQPRVVANAVAAAVGLDAAQSSKLAKSLTQDRPEQTTESLAPILCARDLEWSTDDRAVFEKICAPTMERFGYSMDETYRSPDGPHVWILNGQRAVGLDAHAGQP